MAHQMAMISKVLKSDMEVGDMQPSGEVGRHYRQLYDHAARDRVDPALAWALAGQGSADRPHQDVVRRRRLRLSAYSAWSARPGLAAAQTSAMTAPAAPVSFTETIFNDGMQLAYTNGATPTLMILPPGVKRTASTFTGRSTTQVLVGKTEVVIDGRCVLRPTSDGSR